MYKSAYITGTFGELVPPLAVHALYLAIGEHGGEAFSADYKL